MPRLAERLKDMQVPIRQFVGLGVSLECFWVIWVLVVACSFFLADKARSWIWNLGTLVVIDNMQHSNMYILELKKELSSDMKQLDWQSQLRSVTCLQFVIFAAEARKFAQVLQFTWPGCPLIYYGDELGLEGADDPHNRAPMPWAQVPWCFLCGRRKA